MLFILGMIAAMAVPAMGLLDNAERTRITRERMAVIRRAVLGPDDRFDADGRPIIGGYVGDMQAWPGLWEARAEIRPGVANGWENPSSMSTGYGQGPNYAVDDGLVFRRPSGTFVKKRWRWNTPYRKLMDDSTTNADHIGGLETENEGQPRGLWTRYPEELNFDIGVYTKPGADLGPNWKGPYLVPPTDRLLADADHWAVDDGEYENLAPLPRAVWDEVNHRWLPTWEDGDYDLFTGELSDEKESFRLLQNDGCLADGWDRALRFFITADPDHEGSTVFWIISEGPDKDGVYPAKGTCGGHSWSVDPTDTMATAYDPDADENQDNIVLKLYSRDWEAIFAEETQSREAATDAILERIRRALVGDSPGGLNSGYTGAFCAWSALSRWEDNGTPDDATDDFWDNADDADTAYTKGQPRGLWTATPNSADSGDDLAACKWGIGWRHAFLSAPEEAGADNLLTDAWGREILFFYDTANGLTMVLSRGEDGMFAFGSVNTDQSEPKNPIETVDVTAYDPTAAVNADNCHIVVAESDWRPGFFRLLGFTVVNAYMSDATHGTTKARFFRADETAVSDVDLLVPTVLTDGDGDGAYDDWEQGDGTVSDPAFNFDDTTTQTAVSGARYLVLWNDADDDGEIDRGENYHTIIYPVGTSSGSGQYDAITVDTATFRMLP